MLDIRWWAVIDSLHNSEVERFDSEKEAAEVSEMLNVIERQRQNVLVQSSGLYSIGNRYYVDTKPESTNAAE